MKINDVIDVDIIDNDINGNGIARVNNFVLFIPFCLKGEKVKVKIIKIDKRYGFGEVIEFFNKSNKRCNVLCPYYYECGGCSFLHVSSVCENDIKLNLLKRMFDFDIEFIDGGYSYNYRNKARFHVKDGVIGYYNNESHDLCKLKKCMLVNERINNILGYMNTVDLNGIKEVIVRCLSDKIMVNVICDEDFDVSVLDISLFDSLYINDKYYSGSEYLIDEVNGLKYSVSPNSFYQVNREGMINIYNKVKEYAGSGESLLDLYCGTGTIGIWLSDKFNIITGYEINESSIYNAKINAKLNNLNNIEFILGDSAIVGGKYDVIVVDPPRNGLSKNVRKYLNESDSEKIIYVSCNPFTLKRDLGYLENYKISRFCAFNMFPKTSHIECVLLLEKIDIDSIE